MGLSVSDFLTFTYQYWRSSKGKDGDGNKNISMEEVIKLRCQKLINEKVVKTDSLLTAEFLSKFYGFKCIEVRGPRPLEGQPKKIWILQNLAFQAISPLEVEKSSRDLFKQEDYELMGSSDFEQELLEGNNFEEIEALMKKRPK